MTPQLYSLTAGLRSFVKKHHAILFITLLALLLGLAVAAFYQSLTITFETPIDTTSTVQSFDQKTVDKIENLHDSSDSAANALTFPSSRTNPFSE